MCMLPQELHVPRSSCITACNIDGSLLGVPPLGVVFFFSALHPQKVSSSVAVLPFVCTANSICLWCILCKSLLIAVVVVVACAASSDKPPTCSANGMKKRLLVRPSFWGGLQHIANGCIPAFAGNRILHEQHFWLCLEL